MQSTENQLAPSSSSAVTSNGQHLQQTPESIKRAFLDNLYYRQGQFPHLASKHDYYKALAYTVRDLMTQRWLSSSRTYTLEKSRTTCYLSAEFLLGPHLGNNLVNLGIYDVVKEAIEQLGLNFEQLLEEEEEPGLGNGGLGRLAACYMESLATLNIPTLGYGIRYEFGIFDQDIRGGWQIERTDKWLRYGNAWEIARPEWAVEVKLGGRVEEYTDKEGVHQERWVPHEVIQGVPYDTPILGYRTNNANTLRLWSAQATESFDFTAFNSGDYFGAVHEKIVTENVSKVLYPNDDETAGKRLRLTQQIFFVSCSLQDMINILNRQGVPLTQFHEKFAVQLNDTHPAIAVAELMRLLIDEHDIEWDDAWHITRNTFAYTNHTLLPEALEKWPVALMGALLPRHLRIIIEINHRFLNEVRIRFPGDEERLTRMSLIDETGERYVRMAHLACVGSHAINGVAELHTKLLKSDVLSDFAEMFPERFSNKTNGITPRRFLVLSNPRLSSLITEKIGNRWPLQLDQLRELEQYADDPEFQERWRGIKRAIKCDLAERIQHDNGISVDPDSIFDIQAKRIHEYKRQHLNALHIIMLYNRLKENPDLDFQPRTFLFGGKAAPGYHMAKLMIKLITAIGDVVNHDPVIRDRIKVVFLKDYNVKFAQRVYPAADVSEQISTAGKEASGTGNMKFALNGALTVGTLDGANIEIREEVGAENFFLFGLTAEEVYERRAGGYHPMGYYYGNHELKLAIDRLQEGFFSGGDVELFQPLVDKLLQEDPYFVLADFDDYAASQQRVAQAYADKPHWTRMSILNAARVGKFSSDRSIQEYCDEIWNIQPVPVQLAEGRGDDANLRLSF